MRCSDCYSSRRSAATAPASAAPAGTKILLHKLSVVIITLNEEDRLPRTLEAVAWCDEILVVDSGSSDRTIDICSDYRNCRVIEHAFAGYGPQKRFAVGAARNDWILSLDADEVPDAELLSSLRQVLAGDLNSPGGFYLRRSLVFMGRVFEYGRESRERHLRLFDRRKANFTDALVHERVQADGSIGELAGRLLHYSYRDLDDYFQKFNRYSSLSAARMHAAGRRTGLVYMLLSGPFRFVQSYLIHGNWRNGIPGLVWSILAAYYKTVRYLKLLELNRR